MFITNENIDNDTNINKAIRNLNIIEDFFNTDLQYDYFKNKAVKHKDYLEKKKQHELYLKYNNCNESANLSRRKAPAPRPKTLPRQARSFGYCIFSEV